MEGSGPPGGAASREAYQLANSRAGGMRGGLSLCKLQNIVSLRSADLATFQGGNMGWEVAERIWENVFSHWHDKDMFSLQAGVVNSKDGLKIRDHTTTS